MMYGGYWDKLGNRYEDWWSLVKLMDMLGGESDISSLAREPAGEDERGVDLWVNRLDGRRDAHQCKRRKGPSPGWTMRALQSEDIFDDLRFQLDRGPDYRYVLVSGTPAPDFERLVQEARDSKDAESFYRDQILGNQGLQAAFKVFRESVGASAESNGSTDYEYDLLKRSDFQLFRAGEDSFIRLRERARVAIEGEPPTVIALLADWHRNQLRVEIDVPSVETFLAQHGYRLRPDLGDESRAGIEVLQSRFRRSLRPLLAGGKLIPRDETQRVLDLLDDEDVRVVVVHGAAGKGKSGVLLELAEELSQRDAVFLPVRLDRFEIRGDPQEFGHDLGLPDSPGRCLRSQGRDGAVLILDQLDALRWTGAHTRQAWDVCRQTIQDALRASSFTKVVVCCRTFDLKHDPQFRQWKEDAEDLDEVAVGDLTEDQVKEGVEEAFSVQGGRELGGREAALLRHVHHLQMWLEMYPDLGPTGSLQSRRQLMQRFWEDRRDKLREQAGICPNRIEELEDRLVDEMDEGASLTAPLPALRLLASEKEAYLSLHVLQVEPATNRVSFCHQSYLDYLVALRLVSQLRENEGRLQAWLGPREKQSLFRREQLRLILEELRSRDPELYVQELRSLLLASEVRFHLRLLCLQFLSLVSEPAMAERELVLDLIDDSDWRDHVLDEVVRGHEAWFQVLDDAGVFQGWLESDEPDLRDRALAMMDSVVEASGDTVARLLRPYLTQGAEWTRSALSALRLNPAVDSDELFEMRLQLAAQGAYSADLVDWDELAEAHPPRFIQLAAALLEALVQSIQSGRDRHDPGEVTANSWYRLERVSSDLIPADLRPSAWKTLFRAVVSVARLKRYESEPQNVLETYAVEFRAIEPVVDLLRKLGAAQLTDSWEVFVDLAQQEVDDTDGVGAILFLDSLKEGPSDVEFADWALTWLMEDPSRAQLRIRQSGGRFSLSGIVVERYAAICSQETFRRFEEWLLAYREPDLLERHQHRPGLWDPNPSGRTQHGLLSKLPAGRVSDEVKKRQAELRRKFGGPPASYYQEGGQAQGGIVGSPVDDVLEAMSDQAILKLASSTKLREGGGRRRKWQDDYFEDSSPETIAAAFRTATQRQPERFGELLLRWPVAGHPAFAKAIISGLAFPQERGKTTGSEAQQLPSHDLLESILVSPMVREMAQSPDDLEVARNLCDFLHRYPKHPWSRAAIDFVVWTATHHHHPGPDEYPIASADDEAPSGPYLESSGRKVTRGNAAVAIQSLLFEDPDYLADLHPAIESLVHDPHHAVKVMGIVACLPVLSTDRDQAVDWFLEACSGPDQILGTSYAERFLKYSWETHLERLLPILDRMLASTEPPVATVGATWLAVAHLIQGGLAERFEQCIVGNANQRKGIARAAAWLLDDAAYTERATEVLLRLADDPADDVAKEVAVGFRQLDRHHIDVEREAWSQFARSRAFQLAPTQLLHALSEQSGDLLPFADCLLSAGTTYAEDLAEETLAGRVYSGASHYLLPLLLRLYEQAKDRDESVYQRCLDLWDQLLESRVGRAMGLTRELDRI